MTDDDIKPQRYFDSWTEPQVVTVPLMLQADVRFRRVLDYDGTDSGFVEIILPPAVRGVGTLRLPRTMFSEEFNKAMPEIPKRDDAP